MAGPIVGLGEVLWDLLPQGPRMGGAPFNFAFHCHQLGHPAIIVSRVGDDELGHNLRSEVRRLGMSDEFIQVDPDHPTGTVQVAVDNGGQPTYTIVENVAWDHLAWNNSFNQLIQSARSVCFGTLAQRNRVARSTIHRFVASFAESKIRICDLNLRPPFVDREVIRKSLRLADWLKLNEHEWHEATESESPFDHMKNGLLRSWMLEWGLALLCVTRGAKGCSVSTWRETVEVPGLTVQVADTVGAGDAFTAGLLTQFLDGKSLRHSAEFANALAALVASKPGGTPAIDRAEVERLC